MDSIEREDTYFRYPNPLFLFLIPFGIILLAMIVFVPDSVPYEYLGPIGTLALHMSKNPQLPQAILFITTMVHIAEAYFANKMARSKGLSPETVDRWTCWVFFFGVGSFKYLVAFQPSSKKTN